MIPMKSAIGVLVSLAALASLAGCATILSGSSADIQINSSPSEAHFVVKSTNGLVIQEGVTPANFRLSKSNEYSVTISLDGYQVRTVGIGHAGLEGVAFCNLFNWVGWGIDYMTGAMYKLEPNQINVTLRTAMVDNEPALIITMLDENGDPHEASIPMERM